MARHLLELRLGIAPALHLVIALVLRHLERSSRFVALLGERRDGHLARVAHEVARAVVRDRVTEIREPLAHVLGAFSTPAELRHSSGARHLLDQIGGVAESLERLAVLGCHALERRRGGVAVALHRVTDETLADDPPGVPGLELIDAHTDRLHAPRQRPQILEHLAALELGNAHERILDEIEQRHHARVRR